MFQEYNETLEMVEGAYKKLKSYYYYDKSLLYLKHKIAAFENNINEFEETITKITKCIINKDKDYFDLLIEKIDFIVLPKKNSFTNW